MVRSSAIFLALAVLCASSRSGELAGAGCTPSCANLADGSTPDIDTSAVANDFGQASGPESIAPNMLGDYLSAFKYQLGPSPFGVRTFKLAENQSAALANRVYYGFSHFNDVGGAGINGVLGTQLSRHTFGGEWIATDNLSLGIRVPLFTVDPGAFFVPGLGNISTFGGGTADRAAFGDISLMMKYALVNNAQGDWLTTGVGLTVPTGSDTIAGVPPLTLVGVPLTSTLEHDGSVQPFLAGIRRLGRGVFFQGFLAFDVPLDHTDAVLLFADLQLGWVAETGNSSGLTALAPLVELHSNNPVGQRVLEPGPTGLAEQYIDQVNITTGLTLEFNQRSTLALGLVQPIGNKFFDWEFQAQFNVFGGLLGN